MKRKLINVILILATSVILNRLVAPAPKQQVIVKPEVDIGKEIAPHVVPWISDNEETRSATGFYINYYGKYRILTNRHVCDAQINRNKSHFIQFGDYVGRILYIDKHHDLCLVSSNRKSGLKLADYQSMPLEKVVLVGYPRGIGKVIREGRIIEQELLIAPWLLPHALRVYTYRVSTPAYPGNSGSPVVNTKGKVTGVLFAGSPIYPLEPFIVPLRYVKAFLNEVIYNVPRQEYEQ